MTVQNEASNDRLAMPLMEAAEKLGLGRSAAYEAARKGDLPTIRIGKKFLVPIRALERLLDSAEVTSTQAGPEG